jgi:DNA-binding HxlR family transcriptional regulator
MRSYGQYCPIARGSEIFAERWTPIIVRNLLLGCRTFNEIAAGAPGLSRSLLASRLRELERAGVIVAHPKPDGHGSLYEPTQAGRELDVVLGALASWAERWMEVTEEHSYPSAVLWSWSQHHLMRDRLPRGRVVVRFEWEERGHRLRTWLLLEDGRAEVCPFDPRFDEDLVVEIREPLPFARWHLGLVQWDTLVRTEAVAVHGAADLRDALPTWNEAPTIALERRRTAS